MIQLCWANPARASSDSRRSPIAAGDHSFIAPARPPSRAREHTGKSLWPVPPPILCYKVYTIAFECLILLNDDNFLRGRHRQSIFHEACAASVKIASLSRYERTVNRLVLRFFGSPCPIGSDDNPISVRKLLRHNLGIKKIRINYCTLDTTLLLSLWILIKRSR